MMELSNVVNEQKKTLLTQKASVLQELKYYEKRIKELQNNTIHKYHDPGSSDSDDDSTILFDTGPSMVKMKLEKAMLKTCLQATQELTSLQVLQFESNIIDELVLEGGCKEREEKTSMSSGTWREVTAECKIDLVPFSITFYTFTLDKKFAPTWYRGLRVTVVKAAHEAELSKSVLPTAKKPSEAVAVLKCYSEASRSRRNTLAQLADLYGTSLFMQPMADGGFLLKCDNVLEMSWRLENKWSPFSPFHHKMKFELEYMEETYITRITQTYKKLSNPTISTDERTTLLSEIITLCMKAKESLSDSMKSKLENDKRNTAREIPEKGGKDNEVMAPPKTVPKRSKDKKSRDVNEEDKSRRNNNNTIKTSGSSEGVVAAAGKTDQNCEQHNGNNSHKQKSNTEDIARSTDKMNRCKQRQKTDLDIGETSKKVQGKRSRPDENVETVQDIVNHNPKRNKANDKKLPHKDTIFRNKETSNIMKKSNTGNSKNTQSERDKKQNNEFFSKTKESEVKNAVHKLLENNSNGRKNKDVKVVEKKNVASLKNVTPTDGIPVNRATKNINKNSKTDSANKPSHLATNRERIISSSDRIKKIDNPKHFNSKKPIMPLTNRNNHKSKTRKSIIEKNINNNNNKTEKENHGKISKLPQKLVSHSAGSLNKLKFKTPSNLNSNRNMRKMSNIPRLVKPSISK